MNTSEENNKITIPAPPSTEMEIGIEIEVRKYTHFEALKLKVGKGEYFLRQILPGLLEDRPELLLDLVSEAMSDPKTKAEMLSHIEKLMENKKL